MANPAATDVRAPTMAMVSARASARSCLRRWRIASAATRIAGFPSHIQIHSHSRVQNGLRPMPNQITPTTSAPPKSQCPISVRCSMSVRWPASRGTQGTMSPIAIASVNAVPTMRHETSLPAKIE